MCPVALKEMSFQNVIIQYNVSEAQGGQSQELTESGNQNMTLFRFCKVLA